MGATCISIINSKGGTSKTSSCINLGHSLITKGERVLIVDLDPQTSASLSLGFRNISPSIAEVLLEELPLKSAIQKTSIDGLDLLPGSMALSSFDITFANSKGREYKLAEMLKQTKDYSIILLDCPPTLGLLALNAIVASDRFIVPMAPQYLALEGLATFSDAVERIKNGIGCKAKLMGILMTQVDRRNKSSKEIIKLVRSHYTDKVFKTEVPTNIKIAEAPSFGKTIFQHDCQSTGALAYKSLAKEVLSKIKQEQI